MSAEQLIIKHLDIWTSAHKTRSSAGRGSSSKLDLYGIKKLRELILELAVRGKLVPQDPNDEPASELIKKIEDEKAQLVKEGKIKQAKSLLKISQEEEFFQLPDGWIFIRLGNLFNSIISGGTPSKINQNFWGGDIPWASVKDLGKSKFIEKTEDYITQEGLDAGSKLADKGDVLICTRMGLGKIGICKVPIAINQDLKAVKINSNVSLDFFLIAFSTLKIKGTGTTVAGIKQDELLNYLLALPPLTEQNRIVKKVDELMAFCDQLEQSQTVSIDAHVKLVESLLTTLTDSKDHQDLQTNWQRIAEHFDTLFTTEESIDQLKQTILQLAVMGKLVPQDSNDEPASELLKKIAAEKSQLIKEGKIKKEKPLPEITDEEKPFELPIGWEWVRIDSVCDVQGGIQKQPIRTPKNNHYPYLRVANVQRGYIVANEMERFELFDGELEKRELKKGDILIVEGNGSADEIGRCAIWSGLIENCVFQNHLIRVRSLHSGNEIFISKFLNSISGIAEMKKLAVTTSGLYNLSVGKIRAIAIPLPPVLEQHRIITKVDELITLCDIIKKGLQNSKANQLKLVDAVIGQAVC